MFVTNNALRFLSINCKVGMSGNLTTLQAEINVGLLMWDLIG